VAGLCCKVRILRHASCGSFESDLVMLRREAPKHLCAARRRFFAALRAAQNDRVEVHSPSAMGGREASKHPCAARPLSVSESPAQGGCLLLFVGFRSDRSRLLTQS
jgi:hypothetical protein